MSKRTIEERALAMLGDILENDLYNGETGEFDYKWYAEEIKEFENDLSSGEKWDLLMLCLYVSKKFEKFYNLCLDYNFSIDFIDCIDYFELRKSVVVNFYISDFDEDDINDLMEKFNNTEEDNWVSFIESEDNEIIMKVNIKLSGVDKDWRDIEYWK